MNYRKDDLIGIRKARFASFVLLFAGFVAMLVNFIVFSGNQTTIYIVSAIIIAALLICWWFVYRRILYEEAAFFERVAVELRLLNHRLRMLESAIRGIGDGVIIVADDGEFVIINETVKKLLAAFDSDLDGARYDEYAAGFSEKLECAYILTAAREGGPSELVNVDGQIYKIGYAALLPEKGKGFGAVAVVSDVTENTKAERMQIDFVSNVSHELKTPLASVRGYAETLMDGSVDEKETELEFLSIIVAEADRMDRLVKELLYLASVDVNEPAAEPEESDLPSLIKMSIKKLEKLAGEKSLTVNQMFSDALSIGIEMDRDRIEQVIVNILSNAIKYTDEKGRVDVDIISGQNCVQIVISDNGVGIPEKDLPRVFERFFRVDKSRTGKMGGTGLGLAISKQIVDSHGGAMSIESKFGRGTTVSVSLPMSKNRGTPGIL